jgi:hypothetical protein
VSHSDPVDLLTLRNGYGWGVYPAVKSKFTVYFKDFYSIEQSLRGEKSQNRDVTNSMSRVYLAVIPNKMEVCAECFEG